MSDWLVTDGVLSISHSDNQCYELTAKWNYYPQFAEKDPSQLELTMRWFEGKHGEIEQTQTFYLSGRNLEVFKQFVNKELG